MKQKVVVKVEMNDSKSRTKALKLAVGMPGVTSAALGGDDKDQLVVVGEGVDSVVLTCLLRKKMKYAELISVCEDKKDDDSKSGSATETSWACQCNMPPPPCYVYDPYTSDSCCIL